MPKHTLKRHRTLIAAVSSGALAVTALAVAGTAGAAPATATAHTATTSHPAWRQLCGAPSTTVASCDVLQVTNPVEHVSAFGVSPHATPSGYGSGDLQSAYGLPANGGSGQTIAVIDAYDDPDAASNLATYRKQYGLPACTASNGCFKEVNSSGKSSPLPSKASANQGAEDSLDLDLVSAVAPDAKILFVEASKGGVSDMGAAVNEAVELGAKFVSNSYIWKESSSDPTYDKDYYDHPGVAVVAGSGDWDYSWGVGYPSSSPYVVSVGGTSLVKSSNTRGWNETVWNTKSGEGTGSGCSAYEPKPSWQKDTGCSKRMTADVAAVADPGHGVAVYDSYQEKGWGVYGGTSAATPVIAGVYADAGTPASGSNPASFPYADPGALNDVTSGDNGSCSPAYFCTAEKGYDGPTGLGTPNGTAAFHD
ncbi:S53 family peptidase [Streptomyces sp. PTM05]|uniref:S53 family peptidase n=1 Tax=Streptantibioticus parmotrematis TaxID=2873249 RepID=A0ABS7QXI2_9ACTN|nr:S53 family peptidase [Streptantibioticus parmotrematis]MBY8887070.1 S53 family peptidase [Streptantibioticus parmotrematis]